LPWLLFDGFMKVVEIEFPIEYKKGYIRFLNCKIDLRNRVFIPRIETEFWLKKAIREIKKDLRFKIYELTVLDVFAGSGCIGIAILKNIKNSFVDFVDVDKKAIEQIKINLKINKISKNRYKIYRANLFEKLKDEKYDIIFANPPYVAKERMGEVQPSVLKYEPKRAILAGRGGLFYIKKFLKETKNHLNKSGKIFLEFDPLQKEEIKKILKSQGYKTFEFRKDQFQKYRWLEINQKS